MANYYLRGERYESLEELVKQCKLETLQRWCASHDWYYARADDFRAYNDGQRVQREIDALAAQLGDDGKEIIRYHVREAFGS